jgi:hypothetical protein
MLNQKILQSIECAIAHKCPKEESRRCAQCEIGYSFVACEPMTLECGHHICKGCNKKAANGSLKCKFCAKSVQLTASKGIAAESLFECLTNDLVRELREKYATAIDIYDGTDDF